MSLPGLALLALFLAAASTRALPILSEEQFDSTLGHVILGKILSGKAVNVAVETSRKVAFKQEASCSSCGSGGYMNQVNTTSSLPATATTPLAAFYVVPTAQGTLVPCDLALNYPVPDLHLTLVNAIAPVDCSAVSVIDVITDDATIDATDPVYHSTFIQINPHTGEVIPNSPDGASLNANTYITQTYSGFCIDQRGYPSNSFTFKVTWGDCEPKVATTAATTVA